MNDDELPLDLEDPVLMGEDDDPFVAFTEWASDKDDEAFADL